MNFAVGLDQPGQPHSAFESFESFADQSRGEQRMVLTAEELTRIGKALAEMPVHGARYAEQGMRLIDR